MYTQVILFLILMFKVTPQVPTTQYKIVPALMLFGKPLILNPQTFDAGHSKLKGELNKFFGFEFL